jgi:hypothetical protein
MNWNKLFIIINVLFLFELGFKDFNLYSPITFIYVHSIQVYHDRRFDDYIYGSKFFRHDLW